MCFKSGFLVVKTFGKLYEDYVDRYKLMSEVYAIPRLDRIPSDYKINYRGIDRDSICGCETSDNLADLRLFELEEEQRSQDDFVFEEQDAVDVLQYLDEDTAKEFLDYYLSFDWTERGDFEIVEVFIR